MTIEIRLLPLLRDNYAYLLHDEASGEAAIVDPSEGAPVAAAVQKLGWKLSHILNTHHHDDHIGGDTELVALSGAPVAGPAADRHRIASLTVALSEGDSYKFGDAAFQVLETPGHTSGHISLYLPEAQAVFSGDTLFSLGCGRLFEGTPAQMWQSLGKLRALPDETRIYCGHEYTESNCRFALTIEPDNEALQVRAAEIASLRAEGKPTIPTTMGVERATNPFLRADVPSVQTALGMEGADPVEVFAEIRRRKDNF